MEVVETGEVFFFFLISWIESTSLSQNPVVRCPPLSLGRSSGVSTKTEDVRSGSVECCAVEVCARDEISSIVGSVWGSLATGEVMAIWVV